MQTMLKQRPRRRRRRQAKKAPTMTNICLSRAAILTVLVMAACQLLASAGQVSTAKLSSSLNQLTVADGPSALNKEAVDLNNSDFDHDNDDDQVNALPANRSGSSSRGRSRSQVAGTGTGEAQRRRMRRWLNSANSGASTRVVGVGGQWVELRCPLSSELLDHSTQSIVWRKNGIRLNQLEPRLKIHAHNGSLVIATAQPQLDEATYECALLSSSSAATASGTGTSTPEAVTPPPPRELKWHRFQLKLVVAPRLAPFEFPADAQVGMKLVLTCSALEGQQPISFVWLKDNQIIEASSQEKGGATFAKSNNQQLEPSSLNQLHQRQLADKLANSGQSSSSSSSSASHKSAEYLLLLPESGSPGPEVASNNLAEQQVQVQEEQQQQDSQLLALLSDSNIRVRQADDYSMLSIERLQLKHSGRYTCSAQNELARTSHSAQLLINAPPTLSVEPQDGDLVSGQSALLECAASGQPRPSVGWLRARESSASKLWDYVPIYDNLRYTTLPNGSLAITNVTQREQGFYLCSAKNGFGPEVTKLIKITVHEPARFGPKYKTLEVRVGERANMICAASGELPVRLEWLDKASNVIQANDKRFIIDNDPVDVESGSLESGTANLTLSRLILTRASRADSGHYTCQAGNKFGADKMLTNLLVQDVPDKVTELKVTNTTSSTISLRWQLAFAGNAPVTSYLVQYQSDDPFDDLRPSVIGSGTGTGSGVSDQAADAQAPPTSSTPSALKVVLEALNMAANLEDLADEAIDRTLVELTVEQSATHLVVKELSPYCVYRLRLAAINKIGLGQFSDWIRAKTEEAPPSGVPLKIAASATGPNSIKITWNPPDRRSWNGQLAAFNIGYRSVDSSFGLNKTVEWTPPSLQSMVDTSTSTVTTTDKQQQQQQPPSQQLHQQGSSAWRQVQQGSAIAANLSLLLRTRLPDNNNNAKVHRKSQQADSPTGSRNSSNSQELEETVTAAGTPVSESSQYLLLRQHLRQLLALQQQELVAHLTNLQRSTTYLVWIQAINQRGLGPQSHSVSVKTLDDVPPSAPALKVQSTSANSITITWSMLSNFISSANQYSLFYRRVAVSTSSSSSPIIGAPTATLIGNGSSTEQLPLPPSLTHHFESETFVERTISSQQLMLSGNMLMGSASNSQPTSDQHLLELVKPSFMHQQAKHYQQFVYTLDQLECGSVYELYMTTRNSVGKSEPSALLTTRTMGEPPVAPTSRNSLFSRIGSSDVALNLVSWSTGGCPLTHVTVRYKPAPMPSAAPISFSASPSASNNDSNSSSRSSSSSTSSSSQVASAGSNHWPTTTTSVPATLLTSVNNLLMAHSRSSSSNDPEPLSMANLQPPVYTLKNLAPSTCYELEISAYNSAGQTTALYEFVTLNLNGSRVRANGASLSPFRFDQRHLADQTFDGARFVELHQASSANNNHLQQQQQQQSAVGNQLLPLLFMLFCLMCLIISSSFCYYKLKGSWKSHSRSSSSDDSTTTSSRNCSSSSSRNLHCQQQQQPGKSSVWRLNSNQQSIRRHHSSLLKHRHLQQQQQLQHQDSFTSAPTTAAAAASDNDYSDTNNTPSNTHYCLREAPATNQLMSSNLKSHLHFHHHQPHNQQPTTSSSSFTQSVSMKDFNLIAGQAGDLVGANNNTANANLQTVNFRTYRNPARLSVTSDAAKTATMRARLVGDTTYNLAAPELDSQALPNNSNLQDYGTTGVDHNQLCSIYAAACKQQQQQQLHEQDTYSTAGNQSARSAALSSLLAAGQQSTFTANMEPHQCGYSADGQQQETSWTTAPPSYVNQQQCNKNVATNYAVPSAKYAPDQLSQYDADINHQVSFNNQQDNYGQTSIDACIQQLMGQQYRQPNQQDQQQQQYAMIVNVKLDPAGNRCLYNPSTADSNQLSYSAAPDQVKQVHNLGAQSVVESSVSSGIDAGQSHIDCGSSATGTSNSNVSNDGYQLSQPPEFNAHLSNQQDSVVN